MTYQYNSSNELHGFLRSLFDLGESEYKRNLHYSASSYYIEGTRHLTPDHAFNFNSSSDRLYWLGDLNINENAILTFCLPHYLASLSGFELGTFNGYYRPKSFSFATSFDNKTYTNEQNYTADYSSDLVQYFSYNGSIGNCFRLTCISSSNGRKMIDVDHIEIYGVFQYYKQHQFQTCRIRSHNTITFFLCFSIFEP